MMTDDASRLYAELLLIPMRVHGGRKVHLVDVDLSQAWRGAAALCGSYHEWARGGFRTDTICADCSRAARVLLAPKGNP
jgi:hypothetical protein